MNEYDLTYEERELLQRHRDGDVEESSERERAERLLREQAKARTFVEALGEVELATSIAEEVAWDRAEGAVPMSDSVVDASLAGAPLHERGLEELVPLLERFHDGEVTEEEAEELAALIDEREDVMAYLEGLDALRHGARASHEEMVDDVDFGGFWDSLSARLDEEDAPNVVEFPGSRGKSTNERPAFDLDSNRVTLYRSFDGEADEEEEARVAAWAEIDPTVAQTLDALHELNFAVNVAVETAQERADLSHIWDGVVAELRDELSGAATNEKVISLAAEREKRGIFDAVRRHQSEIVVALVAAVMAVFGVTLFGNNDPIVVEKTVVIVESVDALSEDSSVMVTGPAQAASLSVGEEDAQASDEPTVIWLIEDEADVAADPEAGDAADDEDKQTIDMGDQPI